VWHRAKTNVFRFRCDDDFKERLAAVAKLERRDPSDLARLILEDYIADQEARLTGTLHDGPAPALPTATINRRVHYRRK
jgi:predicted transcriptional regulator